MLKWQQPSTADGNTQQTSTVRKQHADICTLRNIIDNTTQITTVVANAWLNSAGCRLLCSPLAEVKVSC
jgi:hypothetical protein